MVENPSSKNDPFIGLRAVLQQLQVLHFQRGPPPLHPRTHTHTYRTSTLKPAHVQSRHRLPGFERSSCALHSTVGDLVRCGGGGPRQGGPRLAHGVVR
jgi:hypothetical protein